MQAMSRRVEEAGEARQGKTRQGKAYRELVCGLEVTMQGGMHDDALGDCRQPQRSGQGSPGTAFDTRSRAMLEGVMHERALARW